MSKMLGVLLGLCAWTTLAASGPITVLEAGSGAVKGFEGAPYAQYREQNAVLTRSGRIVVVAQGRNKSGWSDRSGQDLVSTWSDDHGKTWSKDVLAVSHGTKSIVPNAAVYDADTDRILVMYNLIPWDYRHPETRNELEDGGCTQYLIESGDGGETWSKPRDISDMIDSGGAVAVMGSGEGIQLRKGPRKGRLLFAGGDFHRGKKHHVFYSDDHGKTWQRSAEIVQPKGSKPACESKLAELPDGTLVLNARTWVDDGSKQRLRTRSFSTDGGATWTPLENDPALETVSCNGDLIAVPCKQGRDGAALLCSVPAGPGRTHGTVYVSLDGGKTWPHYKVLVEGTFAYSSLLRLPDGRIGLFYEHGGHKDIRLLHFTLDEVLEPRVNILLIVSEDNGPELGCYGDPYARTPVLDRLAAEGARFDRAYVPYSVCSPSRACYLTGRYPHQNGQIGLATHKFAMYENYPSMITLLAEAGYFTGLIGKLHVNPAEAFPVDFRRIKGANFGKGQRNMQAYAEAAADCFAEAGERPFFLSINYPDAHFPLHAQDHGLPERPLTGDEVKPLAWVGADSPRLRQFTADYYNCLARLDAGVGMLLEALEKTGKRDNTLIVYIGDHGAQFSRGKCGVYEAGLRVPLIIHGPGVRAGTETEALVSTLDLLPTMLEVTGVKGPEGLPGKPLQSLMAGKSDGGHPYIIGYTNGSAPRLFYPQLSIRDDRFRLVHSPLSTRTNLFAECYLYQINPHFAAGTTEEEIAAAPAAVQQAYATFLRPPAFELYDLRGDPDEFVNLAGRPEFREVQERLWRALRRWQRETRDPLADPDQFAAFVKEQDAQRSLAYRKQKNFRWSYLSDWPAWMEKSP